MSSAEKPLVSIVTPVYNGEPYLRECIESVLAQTYANFEYIILNNFSKDRTLEIAEEYARKDPRIKIFSNDKLLPIIENHNKAFTFISPDSKYCKVVSGDDWLYPECVERMVALAETDPTVGIVCAYQLSGGDGQWYVRNTGLPVTPAILSGIEVGRMQLLGLNFVLGNPTSVIYRADLIRSTDAFFPNPTAEADTSACVAALRYSNFGFVHQVLSFERLHEVRQTTHSLTLNAYVPSRISDLIEYGPHYLKPDELKGRVDKLLAEYYEYLADSVFDFRNEKFWTYHKRRLQELGHPLSGPKLGWAVGWKVVDMVFNPKRTLEALWGRLRPGTTA